MREHAEGWRRLAEPVEQGYGMGWTDMAASRSPGIPPGELPPSWEGLGTF